MLTAKGFFFVRNFSCDIIYSINNPEVAFIDVIAKYEENLLEKEATMENLIKLYKTKKSRFRIKHS